MYNLRTLDQQGVESNQELGNSFNIIIKEVSPSIFAEVFQSTFNIPLDEPKKELKDVDVEGEGKASEKQEEKPQVDQKNVKREFVYGFITVNNVSIPLYKGLNYQVISANGSIFRNLSV